LSCTQLWLTCAVVLLAAATAAADPVRITSGAFVYPAGPGGITVDLAGDGFTFSGGSDPFSSLLFPREQCSVPECTGGTTVNLLTRISGLSYRPATATYQGRTYTNVGGLTADSGISTEWDGSLTIPVGFTGGTLSAPFTFNGLFQFGNSPFVPTGTAELFGSGTATLTFAPYLPEADFPNRLQTVGVRFDFAPGAAATPEPASMILLGTGLVGLVGARRRQRRANVP